MEEEQIQLLNSLPDVYRQTIIDYIEKLKKQLGKKLKMILLIGSCASGSVIENWSDIDFILVIDKYKMEDIEQIKQMALEYPIKIGNTVYSSIEFENKKIDPKTYYYLMLAQEKEVGIQYQAEELKRPIIGFEECKEQYETWLMEHIHSYKRMWLYPDIADNKIRDVFKNTYLIMKAILIVHGKRPKNYQDAVEQYASTFHYPQLDFKKFIYGYQENSCDKEYMLQFAKKFSEDISNNLVV